MVWMIDSCATEENCYESVGNRLPEFGKRIIIYQEKMNDLIFEYQNRNQSTKDDAIYQDKLRYPEAELLSASSNWS